MPLLPYDYLHLVNCPEVVTISDIFCIAHFLHLFGLPERVRENRQRNAQADSDFIIALVALWVLRVEVLSFQLILECEDLN